MDVVGSAMHDPRVVETVTANFVPVIVEVADMDHLRSLQDVANLWTIHWVDSASGEVLEMTFVGADTDDVLYDMRGVLEELAAPSGDDQDG